MSKLNDRLKEITAELEEIDEYEVEGLRIELASRWTMKHAGWCLSEIRRIRNLLWYPDGKQARQKKCKNCTTGMEFVRERKEVEGINFAYCPQCGHPTMWMREDAEK